MKTKKEKKLPVIIGAGITGMCISRELSRAKIKHVMIGDLMIDDKPKLGESMNESASIDFLQDYADFSECYFDKNEICFYDKELVMYLNLQGSKGHSFYDIYEKLGFESDTEYASMVHVDRIQFDKLIYNDVINSKYVTQVVGVKVSDIKYDSKTDEIKAVVLDNGEILESSFVFDGTNHIRLLSKLLNIDTEIFDKPRRVIHTHFGEHNKEGVMHCCKNPDFCSEKWMHGTNIVRMYKEVEGIDAVCWAISQGGYISVGASIDLEQSKLLDNQDVIDKVVVAYKDRGIDIKQYYKGQKEVMVVPYTQHFISKKLHGKNWLLAGGTAVQAWFPSGSNISISIIAAKIAPKLISGDSSEWLKMYEKVCENLKTLHFNYDRFCSGFCKKKSDMAIFGKGIFSSGNKRMAQYALARNDQSFHDIAKSLSVTDIPEYAVLAKELRVGKSLKKDQRKTIDKLREKLLSII